MIAERQRYQSPSRQPTVDVTERQAVLQRSCPGAAGVRDNVISVGLPYRSKPTGRMERRRTGMTVHQIGPARILDRINVVNGHCVVGRDLRWCAHAVVLAGTAVARGRNIFRLRRNAAGNHWYAPMSFK